MRPLVFCLFLVLAGCAKAQSQQPTLPAEDPTFARIMAFAQAEQLHTKPIGEILQAVGLQLQGKAYEAGMLDAPEEETLITTLERFDCVLFVESVLALARGIAVQDYRYDTFVQHLRDQRYRDGTMDGYCSRLHYFSEWIHNNEVRGTVENITQAIGGEPLDKSLTFMSAHRSSYPRFATNDSLFAGIRAMERDLADLALYYIPQDRIRTVYADLQAGDIVALATHLKGLDVTHTGLVFAQPDGTKGLLHASTAGEVMVSPDLQAYVENNRVQIGIVVARPADPRK